MVKSDSVPLRGCVWINKLFKFPIETKTDNQKQNETKQKAGEKGERKENGRRLFLFGGGIVYASG